MRRGRAIQAVGAAGLAVVLTGCMKIDMDLTVSEGDTVDGVMIMAVDQGLAEMSGDADTMVEEMLGGDVPEGATAEPYEDDNFVGAQYTFEDLPLDDFDFDESDTETLSIVHEGDEIVVSGSMDMSDTEEDIGGLGEGGAFAEQLMDSMEVRIAITFPGEVIETTGEVDGTTVTWEPVIGEVNEISARAKDSGGAGGLPIWAWILIGVVVVAAIAGLLFLLARSRKSSTDESADESTGSAGDSTGDSAAASAVPAGFPPPPPAEAGPGATEATPAGAFAADDVPADEAPMDDVLADEVPVDEIAVDEPATLGEHVVEEEPAAPPAPAPPPQPDPFASPDDAGEAPQDVTGVADATETVADVPPADAEDGGDTLEPPR